MKKRTDTLWVVEIRIDGKWMSTTATSTDKQDAKLIMQNVLVSGGNDKRLVQYARMMKGGKK